jgi:hypothetical protein
MSRIVALAGIEGVLIVQASSDARALDAVVPGGAGVSTAGDLQAPRGGALGTTEELSTNDYRNGCLRWPHGFLLHAQVDGLHHFFEGACGAVNLCPYCAKRRAWENAEMVALENELGTPPQLLAIVGTRTATVDNRAFYRAREFTFRALRKEVGPVQYGSFLEFTTGLGQRSGGLRRPHWNWFLKLPPAACDSPADVDQVRELIREHWCRHVDAEPDAQYVEQVRDATAAPRYVALHFEKPDQAPPEGWSGQRLNFSRGFFDGRTVTEMRALAHEAQALRRLRWALLDSDAGSIFRERPELLQQAIESRLAQRARTVWQLKAVGPKRVEAYLSMDPATGEIS